MTGDEEKSMRIGGYSTMHGLRKELIQAAIDLANDKIEKMEEGPSKKKKKQEKQLLCPQRKIGKRSFLI